MAAVVRPVFPMMLAWLLFAVGPATAEQVIAEPVTAEQVRPLESGPGDTSALTGPASPVAPAHESAPPAVGAAPQQAAAGDGDADTLTLVLMGDTGSNGSDQPVRADGPLRQGSRLDRAAMIKHAAPFINGDLNFANLETVVTARNDLKTVEKAFNFRSHPAHIAFLVKSGINVFGTANNHAIDYGTEGMLETVRNLDALRGAGLAAFPGVAANADAAATPSIITLKNRRVAIGAIGIGGGRAGPDRPGMLSWYSADDLALLLTRFQQAQANYRVLSVHYNTELDVRAGPEDVQRLRDKAVREAGVDLVVGHHAHVPAGVQALGGKIILYGLGNFLHPGMRDMAGMGACRDYGLMIRLHVRPGGDGKLTARAIEAIILKDMHFATRPMAPDAAHERLAVLNYLAAGLDHPGIGAQGVRFTPQPDGRGLACFDGAQDDPGKIGALCRAFQPAPPTPSALERKIAASCGGPRGEQTARRSAPSSKSRSVAGQQKSPFESLFGL